MDNRIVGAMGAGSPTPMWPAVAGLSSWLLTVGAVVTSAILGGVFPAPFETTTTVADYFRSEGDAALAAAAITVTSVVPLALMMSGLAGLLASLRTADGAGRVVMTAGAMACSFVALSAAGIWVLTRPEAGVHTATTHVVADVVFVAGGPLFAEMIGLVCLTVAGCTRTGRASLPRGLGRAGFAIGAAGILGVLGIIWSPLILLMPVARFGGLGWLTAVAFVLGRRLSVLDGAPEDAGLDTQAVSR